ncbi:MAG: transcription elongation factor GreA [Patescibacteria group bacterium]
MDEQNQIQYISIEKQAEFKKELKFLKEEKIPELAKRIDDARQMGDLSENAEYHAAREEMAWAQSHVKEVEYILDHAEIIDDASVLGKKGTVHVGSVIRVATGGKEREFTIVGGQEADPAKGKISNESPTGEAFLGKKKGDDAQVKTPGGMQTYKILDVA